MRILIYGLNFAPELTGIGKYTGEMAAWLSANGHEVRVITAPPYYPNWKIGKGYSSFRYQVEYLNGGKVWRCPLWVPEHPSGLKRILHLASFALSSWFPLICEALTWKPDLIFTVEPTLFGVPGTLIAGRLSNARTWMHIQDFEVDAAFELGLLKSQSLREIVAGIEARMMRCFTFLSTISLRMVEVATAKTSRTDIRFFPNWVDVSNIYPIRMAENRLYDELGISREQINVLYSGNLGEKQGLEIIIEVARLLVGREDVRFIICGDGGMKSRLMSMAEGMPNVQFLPLQPIERLNELLNIADIHLMPQRSDVADLVMPSKLTGIFASGKAVIATANPGTAVELALAEVGGLTCPPERPEELASAISLLIESVELRESIGHKARQYAVSKLDKESILSAFVSSISD